MTTTPHPHDDAPRPPRDSPVAPRRRGGRPHVGQGARKRDTRSPVSIRDPGELVAAIPPLLGFVPRRSLVLIGFEGPRLNRVGPVMRTDLLRGGDDGYQMDGPLDGARAFLAANWTPGMVAVLVDDNPDREGQRGLAGELAARLAAAGTELLDVLAVAEIARGSRWAGVREQDRGGTVPDPFGTELAALTVFSGLPIRADRSEYDELLRPRPQWQRNLVGEAIDAQVRGAGLARALVGAEAARGEVEHVLAVVDSFAAGGSLVGPELARLALAVGDRDIRDCLIATALTGKAEAAERLWLHLARELPDPQRADPATLAGYSAYVRGEGALAAVAFDSALRSNPRHGLAGTLRRALLHGMPPQEVRCAAEPGFELAAALGVVLPPVVGD